MDCKKTRYNTLKQLLAVVCLLAFTSCTWVKDDNDDCQYGCWLKLNYTYNILDVDAASKYVKDAHIYVYDKDGRFVKRVDATQGQLAANDYKVEIPELAEGDYQCVVWSGTDHDRLSTIPGDSIGGFKLALNDAGKISNTQLPSIYNGYVSSFHYSNLYKVQPVTMMKDTKQLNCIIVSIDTTVVMNPDDYTMKVEATNGVLNAQNLFASTDTTTYEPFNRSTVEIDDEDLGKLKGIMYNISTLRMLLDSPCRLILKKNDPENTVFNISLAKTIGNVAEVTLVDGRKMTVQEYLDRQDTYTFVFVLSSDLESLIDYRLAVLNWRIRNNEAIKLK
jgi:hypothetical protein